MRRINWTETNKKLVEELASNLTPMHYRQARHLAVWGESSNGYSDKTDVAEKIRQRYGERYQDEIGLVSEYGDLVLRRWFPDQLQSRLFSPEDMWPGQSIVIQGDCIVSYETGFEQALRQQYMKDHFSDAESEYRYERRRRGALAESHVKHFFQTQYPEYYDSPSNEGQYRKPAKEDFFLITDFTTFPIDVKTWTHTDNGKNHGYIRKPKRDVIYLFADWLNDDTTAMHGIAGGRWIKYIGETYNGLTCITDDRIWSIEALLIALNLDLRNLSYLDYHRKLKRRIEYAY